MAGKIRFSGAQKFVLLKASSGERWVSCNFVHLMTLRGTDVHLIIYLFVHQMKQVMKRLLCISINLPYVYAWNTVVTSGLVPPVATWNC